MAASMLDYVAVAMNEYPSLWVMFGLSALLPLMVAFAHCFWLKHLGATAHRKKTDEPTPHDAATPCRAQSSNSSPLHDLTSRTNRAMFKTMKEQPVPVEGTVKGSIPLWVSGRLLRNGPGMFEIGEHKYKHWFDGLALLHSFIINNGKVLYQSRYLRSQSYLQNIAANRIVVNAFGTATFPDPCKTIFQRMLSVFVTDLLDNNNVTIYPIGRDFVAAAESDTIYSFDAETLETKDKIELSKYVAVNTATAHAHYEGEATYNVGSSFRGRPHFNIIKIHPQIGNGQLRAEVLCSIPTKRITTPNYYHSFGMTEGYFVFLEQPIYISLSRLFINKFRGNPLANGLFIYDYNEKVRLYVVDRHTGKVVETKYMSADTFFCFHHVNAYEDKGHLVVDLCCYDDADIYDYFDYDVRSSEDFLEKAKTIGSKTSVRRYVLPLEMDEKAIGENLVTLDDTNASAVLQKDGTVVCTHELLSPIIGFDLPQINYRMYNGKNYSILYGVTSYIPQALVRLDIKTKQTKFWEEEDCIPSEPVFVARPGGTEEDDGIILSSVLHTAVGRSPFLLVLDARNFEEIARVEFEGVDIPKDLHGLFCPSSFPGSTN